MYAEAVPGFEMIDDGKSAIASEVAKAALPYFPNVRANVLAALSVRQNKRLLRDKQKWR